MKNLYASSDQPVYCPYCHAEFSVFKLGVDSPEKFPYKGLPYRPEWFCLNCGGKILKSYSGGVFWGKKINDGKVAYRFMLSIQGQDVYFLDHHYLSQRVVGAKQIMLFYDIIEMMPIDQCASGPGDGWWFHLSYPDETRLVTFSGRSASGKRIMEEAIEALGLTTGFPED